MKNPIIINKNKYWIKGNTKLSSNFDLMNDGQIWDYITKNKLLHKEDGPAIIWSDGSKEWWINGELHRLGGPAVIYSDGSKDWYLSDICVNVKIYQKIQKCVNFNKLKEYKNNKIYEDYLPLINHRLKLLKEEQISKKDKKVKNPIIIYKNKYWIKDSAILPPDFDSMNDSKKYTCIYENNLIHREDGPALINHNGSQAWSLNGQRHRIDGPAIECSNGHKEWRINGLRVDEKIYKKIQECTDLNKLKKYKNSKTYKNYYLPLINHRLKLLKEEQIKMKSNSKKELSFYE